MLSGGWSQKVSSSLVTLLKREQVTDVRFSSPPPVCVIMCGYCLRYHQGSSFLWLLTFLHYSNPDNIKSLNFFWSLSDQKVKLSLYYHLPSPEAAAVLFDYVSKSPQINSLWENKLVFRFPHWFRLVIHCFFVFLRNVESIAALTLLHTVDLWQNYYQPFFFLLKQSFLPNRVKLSIDESRTAVPFG